MPTAGSGRAGAGVRIWPAGLPAAAWLAVLARQRRHKPCLLVLAARAVTQPAYDMAGPPSPSSLPAKDGCVRRRSPRLFGSGFAVPVWRWPAPSLRRPLPRPDLPSPLVSFGGDTWWCRCSIFSCVCRALGACGLAAGLPAVGLRDHGGSAPDPASFVRIWWNRCCSRGHRWCSGSNSFYAFGRRARSLAAGEPAARLCVCECPPPVPLVGEGRAPSRQYNGIGHACSCSDGKSVVATSRCQLYRPDEAYNAICYLVCESSCEGSGRKLSSAQG
jgi:hypothetical protein